MARTGPLSVGASAFAILLTSSAVRLGPLSVRWLGSTVLHADGLRRLAVALEVVSEDLLKEYREASDTTVVDFFDFVAH